MAVQCPAIAAESLEIGQAVLRMMARSSSEASSSVSAPAMPAGAMSGSPGEETHFRSNFQSSCREALRKVQRSFQMPGLTVVEELRSAAMRPVLIESAASGLLEAAAAANSEHRRSLTLNALDISTEAGLSAPGMEEDFSQEDLDLLLGPSAEVQKAGLKYLWQMLSEGELYGRDWTLMCTH